MAATLDADQELLHFSFPIDKQEDTDFINPVDGTPDIWIVGKATDGTVDADRQIVDPQWSAVALKEWAATGGNVRMSHDPKRPVGKGHDVQVTTDGHFVKSLISDPLAKHFIRTGVLNDYSVGISMPHVKFGPDRNLDPQGKATGGIITGRPDGLSKIAELSVVDRGSNFSSKFQITRKSAGGGDDFGFTGEMVGSQEEITSAAPAELLAKVGGVGLLTKSAPADDLVSVDLPPGASISISPADFARLHTFKQQLVTKTAGTGEDAALKAVMDAEAGVYKRDIDTATRRRLAADHKALPNLSYPIENAGDLENAAHLARTGHGDVAAARRLIARRAEELGVANPLDESDKSDDVAKSETGVGLTAMPLAQADPAQVPQVPVPTPLAEKAADAPAEQAEVVPDVTKDPDVKDAPVKKAKKKAKGPKRMPPWLKSDDDADSKGSDDDEDSDDASKSAAPEACKSFIDHDWVQVGAGNTAEVMCEKCHTTPAAAAGVTTAPMEPAPVKELLESDGPACTKAGDEPEAVKYAADLAPDPEVAALLRFKAAGTPEDLGRLHDLTCPAFHPEMAAKYHPYADMGALIDSGAWQRKTLAAAAGPLKGAMEMQEMWQAALLLKTADAADLNDWRLELHKAFRDANPGPGSYPTPGCVMPQRYNRPVLTDGRAANGVDYAGPNSSPQVATSAPDAQSFDRPPLSAGHQSPSPSHMKGDGTYPHERGVPTQLSYAQVQREGARQALVRMHHHLARQFPEACPIDFDGPAQPERHAVPVPAGIGKAIEPEPVLAASPAATGSNWQDAAFKATPEEADLFADVEVYKSFKKMRRKLGKKILSGKMTVDEARAHLGRQFAQKGGEPSPDEVVDQVRKGVLSADEARALLDGAMPAALADPVAIKAVAAPLTAAVDPEVIKAAVTEATSELKELLVKQQETFTTKLAEQQRVIDAIADQPDPSTAAFSGLAFQPGVMKSRRPAAVPDQAEYAARAQDIIRRNLQHTYQTHSNPSVREAAGEALANLGVGTEAPVT